MTPNDQRLDEAFRAVAASGPQGAPMAIEAALRQEFRQMQRWRKFRIGASWAGLTAAAAAGILTLMLARRPEIPPPSPFVARIEVPVTPVTQPTRAIARKPVRPRREKPQAAEVATSFYSLPEASSMLPLEYGSVVRVQLPRSAMRIVGLPVNQDRVFERIQADVLLGQDGLARAIRFVQ